MRETHQRIGRNSHGALHAPYDHDYDYNYDHDYDYDSDLQRA